MSTSLNRLIKNVKRRNELLISPRLDEYLQDRDELFPLSDATARQITALLIKTPRERLHTISASARGRCLREQVFGYFGADTVGTVDVVQRQVFADGHWRHLRWQSLLLDANLVTDIEFPVSITKNAVRVMGSIDAVDVEACYGVEIKGSSRPPRSQPNPEHMLQVASYFVLCQKPVLRKFAVIYENKSTQEWSEFVVDRSDAPLREAQDEIRELIEHINTRRLPSMLPECKEERGAFRRCDYRHICAKAQITQDSQDEAPRVTVRVGSVRRRSQPLKARRTYSESRRGAGEDQ